MSDIDELGYDPSEEKLCSGCDEIKLLREFHRDRTHKDGYKSHCKACRSGKPMMERPMSPERAELEGKTLQELEQIARTRALKRLVESNQQEFYKILGRCRTDLGISPRWTQLR